MELIGRYISSRQICALYGYSRERLRQLAVEHGVKPAFWIGRAAIWDARDLPKLRPKSAGRPRKRKARRVRRQAR